jgi:hypothetical protein
VQLLLLLLLPEPPPGPGPGPAPASLLPLSWAARLPGALSRRGIDMMGFGTCRAGVHRGARGADRLMACLARHSHVHRASSFKIISLYRR